MVALLCIFLLASSFKSNGRLEAENAALRHQLIVLQRKGAPACGIHEQRSAVLYPAVSLVPIDPQGHDDHPNV
jgi:hypothetical protein